MPPNIWHDVEFELRQIRRLHDICRPIVAAAQSHEPRFEEVTTVGAFLHSFYTGAERVFEIIARRFDGGVPSGKESHLQLLNLMARNSENRQQVLSEKSHAALNRCRTFRHVFRHRHVFELDWRTLQPLVADIEDSIDSLEQDVVRFIAVHGAAIKVTDAL